MTAGRKIDVNLVFNSKEKSNLPIKHLKTKTKFPTSVSRRLRPLTPVAQGAMDTVADHSSEMLVWALGSRIEGSVCSNGTASHNFQSVLKQFTGGVQ